MNIPQHLSVTGDSSIAKVKYDDAGWAEREKVVSRMSVPDRITVAGGDHHQSGPRQQPQEMVLDQLFLHDSNKNEQTLKEVPQTIRLDREPYPDMTDPVDRHEESASAASIAIDDNPLEELKLMRRQMTRMTQRLYMLEDAVDRHRGREFAFGSAIAFLGAVIAALFLRR